MTDSVCITFRATVVLFFTTDCSIAQSSLRHYYKHLSFFKTKAFCQ